MKILKQLLKASGLSKISFIVLIALVVIILGVIGWGYFKFKKDSPSRSVTHETSNSSAQTKGVSTQIEDIPIPAEFVLGKDLIKSKDIVLEKVNVAPQIPGYTLPLKIKNISNYENFHKKFGLSSKALDVLEKNGFVVIPTPKNLIASPDDFANYYSVLKGKELPIFITSDSLLHYYHIFFDTTLMGLERDIFYQDIWKISKEFLADAIQQYNTADGDLKEAAKRNVAYFSVALELLRPKKNQVMNEKTLREEYCPRGTSDDYCKEMLKGVKERYGEKASFKYFSKADYRRFSFEIPDFVRDLVQKEIGLIERHEGWEYSPAFVYKEDYSQYVPRGHYTKSERLKNYFNAMMWYGRMTALIKGTKALSKGESKCLGSMDGIISEYDAKIQTLQAGMITKKFSESRDIQGRWQRMYAITSFFVGFSDDLGPYEYKTVLENLFKDKITSEEIVNRYSEIKKALLKLPYNPKIYSGLGSCELSMPCPPLSEAEIQKLKPQAKGLLEETKGFRMMGQRFTIDSYLFSEIVSPYSGEYNGKRTPRPFTWVKTNVRGCPEGREVRGFPRGLDIMALFGSNRAKEILKDLGDTEYSDYEKKFSELKKEIDSFSKNEWFKNLYWNWLYVLRSLPVEFGRGYQTFMQTKAWQDKELNTALASWAELRHDTILYVKQSYTMAESGDGGEPPIVGYVEPVPEFYARLLNLTKMTNRGLKSLVPVEVLEKLNIEPALNRFSEIISKLLEISKKELENKPLTENEYYFIESFGETSSDLIGLVSGGEVEPDIFKTVLVADVHTDGNTKQVLEEGVGRIKTLVVAYKLPHGHILLGVGPVFSYYEFKQPMANRLTDEAWKEMLNTRPPSVPEWTKTFSE
jgi:hypothetical protein